MREFAVHVTDTTTTWLDDDGWHRTFWSRAKQRRDTKRFIREEVARRKLIETGNQVSVAEHADRFGALAP